MAKKSTKSSKSTKKTKAKAEVKETVKAEVQKKFVPDRYVTLINKSKGNAFIPYAGDISIMSPNDRFDFKERLLGAIPKEVRVIKK
jgi:hypothetical protein